MPGPYEGVLYAQDRMGNVHEVINQARTAAYLAHPDLALNGLSICDILDFGGCEAYATILECIDDEWTPMQFDTPTADEAPWYSERFPQSADALGFYIEQWTGLDDGHLKRDSTGIGGYGGGSRLGNLSSEGRIMKLNVTLFGLTNEATEYLFRWLSSVLSNVCSTCDTSSILIRRYCPAIEDPWDGVVQLRRVALVEGLRWEAELIERGACMMRRASFTLEAGDPCMYMPDTDRLANDFDTDADVDACLAAATLNEDRLNCRPGCTELTSTCRTIRTIEADPLGAVGPVVTWENSQGTPTYPFRAIVYSDPGELGAVPNPCGLQIVGELYVRAMPAYSSLRWDVPGRVIEYRDHTTGGWTSGFFLIDLNDPPERRFFALPCGMSQLVMEPSSFCAAEVDPTEFTLDGVTYDPPRFPTVSIRIGERIGCA